MSLTPGARMGSYEVLAPLGVGGMGEVYRARDRKLDREVAIKVLPANLSQDKEALARFEREAKVVAALSHPNILAIHDFGTHEGVAYAVMELLEGETLRGKLEEGPLPAKQVVDFALQIVRGLAAAHERGVVHRDLKPDNLFVTRDGLIKILDFGLAKKNAAVVPGQKTSAPTVSGRTQPGTVMGTLGYMSPEQVKGLPSDHRSDIFSFGAVLYEMFSGSQAFSRPTASETIAAILKEEPPELKPLGGVSPSLDRIARHCLEKDPEKRFQSARDIAFALSEASSSTIPTAQALPNPAARTRKILLGTALLVILAVAGVTFWRRFPSDRGGAGTVKRVAVLPFENLGAPEDDYFADGMADAIRGKLTALPGIEVIARGSSIGYKKSSKTPKVIAQELDAQYLLTATVRWQKSGGASRVQVSPELVEIRASGAPASRWQQPFDATLTDVFQVQSDIAARTAQALGVALGSSEERRLSEKPTQNLAAYDAFLKGEESFKQLDDARPALGFYEQAVALDPQFAAAWAGLSWVCSALYDANPTPQLKKRAKEGAERALALDPQGAEGYLALGIYEIVVLWELDRALEHLVQAGRLSPRDAEVLVMRGAVEINLGRWHDAFEHYREAENVNPRAVDPKLFLGFALGRMRRYSEALQVLDRGLAVSPNTLTLIWGKVLVRLSEGNLAAARELLSAAPREIPRTTVVASTSSFGYIAWVLDDEERDLLLRLEPGAFEGGRRAWAFSLAEVYALKGDAARRQAYGEEARKIEEEHVQEAPRLAVAHAALGQALAYCGRKEEAIQEAERALALSPGPTEGWIGADLQNQAARIYLMVGEPEKALNHLETLLKVSHNVTPGWLRIDPNFDALRSNPRFQKLMAGK